MSHGRDDAGDNDTGESEPAGGVSVSECGKADEQGEARGDQREQRRAALWGLAFAFGAEGASQPRQHPSDDANTASDE